MCRISQWTLRYHQAIGKMKKYSATKWLGFAASIASLPLTTTHPIHSDQLLRRAEITPDDLLGSYDFIIVGGGQAGTVIASRLSEDPSVTVLVVEYGYFNTDPAHLEPSSATTYLTRYRYNMTSVPQTGLNGRTQGLGMLLNRGSAADYDSWEALGNEGWGWDGLFEYFKKSSRFDPPSPAAAEEFNMTWGENSYSENGPIHLSFSSWQFPGIKVQREAIIEAGAEPQVDGQDGHAYGVFWYPTALDNTTAQRSYAVNGYYEPASGRENLHVLTGYRVDNLEFDEDKKVTGVALTQRIDGGSGTPLHFNVGVDLEAVVSAGAMHSPQVLQRSGIGPSWLLDQADIAVISDLPGVGSNLQDHAVSSAFYIYNNNVQPNPEDSQSNSTFQQWAQQELREHHSGPLRIATGNTGGEVPLTTVDPEGFQDIVDEYLAQNAADYLPETYIEEQVAGYEAQREQLAAMMASPDNAWLELPLQASGRFSVVLIKTIARGTVLLRPDNIYADPAVDYMTFVNPTEISIMTSNHRFVRRMHSTSALQALSPLEIQPGSGVQSDAQFETYLRNGAGSSIAHNAGTCAMQPRELGGVVDAELLVYGVSGVSVADASIMPIIPAAHTCSTVYAIAEKAADIIKARHGLS
ncbi:GMC oxidoreductase domain-containing protein [Sarocladium implicatum]|nr:GMC oxidoreductase domain-containing protein [Sarocladium implicatum]